MTAYQTFQNPEDGYNEVTFDYIMSQSWQDMNYDRQLLLQSRIRFVLTQLLWPSSITSTQPDGSLAFSLEQRSEAVKIMIFKMIPDPRILIDHTCICLFNICIELRQDQRPINFENVVDVYQRTHEERRKTYKQSMFAEYICSWMAENLDPCHVYYGGPAMIHVVEDHINKIYDDFISLRLSQIYRYKEIALAHGYSLKECDDVFLENERKVKDLKPKPNMGLSQQVQSLLESMKDFKQGLSSGLRNLDHITKGWKDGCLYVVAGRPAMGKTAVSLTFALAAMQAQPNKKTLFFSLEMPDTQLIKRLASNWSGISQTIFDQPFGQLASHTQDKIAETLFEIKSMPLEIIDRAALSIDEMRSICDIKKRSEDVGLIIVDYLQLMTSPAMIREQEISQISRGLKALAKEMSCPVIALAQINRGVEQRANKRPLLSDLRESGAIEQDADVVMMLYREYAYDEHASETDMEIIVTKNRHGECKTAHVEFLGSCQRISDRQHF
jgi:replicative DNA helicase